MLWKLAPGHWQEEEGEDSEWELGGMFGLNASPPTIHFPHRLDYKPIVRPYSGATQEKTESDTVGICKIDGISVAFPTTSIDNAFPTTFAKREKDTELPFELSEKHRDGQFENFADLEVYSDIHEFLEETGFEDYSFFFPEIASPSQLKYLDKIDALHKFTDPSTIPLVTLLKHNSTLIIVPIVLSSIWLLLPTFDPGNRDCQSFLMFVFLQRLPYCLLVMVAGVRISSFFIPTPNQKTKKLLYFVGCVVYVSADFVIQRLYFQQLRLVLPISLVLACVVFLVGIFFHFRSVAKAGFLQRHNGHSHGHQRVMIIDKISGDDVKLMMRSFLYLVMLFMGVLGVFYYCQAFTAIYFTWAKGDEYRQFVLGLIFPWSLTFPFVFLGGLASRLDANAEAWERNHFPMITHTLENTHLHLKLSPRINPLIKWLQQCFGQMFSRNLFTSLEGYGVLVGIQATATAVDFVVYIFRMSLFYRRAKLFVLKFPVVGRLAKWFFKSVGEDLEMEIEEYRKDLAVDFYLNAMVQRMSIAMYAVNLAIITKTYNQPFFVHDVVCSDSEGCTSQVGYNVLLQLCGIMLVFEWTGSFIIWALMKFLYNIESLRVGATETLTSCCVLPMAMLAVHICQDVYFATNNLNFDCIDRSGAATQ